jgi:hypothetical protein
VLTPLCHPDNDAAHNHNDAAGYGAIQHVTTARLERCYQSARAAPRAFADRFVLMMLAFQYDHRKRTHSYTPCSAEPQWRLDFSPLRINHSSCSTHPAVHQAHLVRRGRARGRGGGAAPPPPPPPPPAPHPHRAPPPPPPPHPPHPPHLPKSKVLTGAQHTCVDVSFCPDPHCKALRVPQPFIATRQQRVELRSNLRKGSAVEQGASKHEVVALCDLCCCEVGALGV